MNYGISWNHWRKQKSVHGGFLSTEKGLVPSTIKLSSQLLTPSVSQLLSRSISPSITSVNQQRDDLRAYLIFLNGIDSYW